MAIAVVIKEIKPQRFNDAAFRQKILAAMVVQAQDMKADFEKTVETWDHEVGFEISSTAPAAINANGGTYIYLAIA